MTEPFQPLATRSVLLIEDETTISFLIEDMLRDLGAADVWHAATVPGGLELLQRHAPSLAVLDVNLGGTPVYPIAEQLAERRIPFLFITGYGRGGLEKNWSSRPVVQKPMAIATLEKAICEVLDIADR